MRCWALLPVLLAAADECVGDDNALLQEGVRPAPDRSPSGLEDLADRLLKAKKECLISSMDCLPALKQVRYRVWPYVMQLSHWHHKAWEPVDFHPQVAKAQMTCSGQENHTIFLMHVWKAAGWASMQNLERVAGNYEVLDSFDADYAWCEKLGFNSLDPAHRSTFTFVREPLARLISGYAEIERVYFGPRYEFLNKAQKGTKERAKIFMDRFFEDGYIYNGHVKPQSEYFAPFSSECSLPMDFVGKTERIQEDWKKFLESRHCEAANAPFSHDLGQHPTNGQLREAMTEFLNKDNHAYLRAFCWLLLSDYVMFDYDLPEKCNDVEMLTIMDLTKAKAAAV